MAPRGRPPKNRTVNGDVLPTAKKDDVKKQKRVSKKEVFLDENNQEIDPPRQKRKYTRRKNLIDDLSKISTKDLTERQDVEKILKKSKELKESKESKETSIVNDMIKTESNTSTKPGYSIDSRQCNTTEIKSQQNHHRGRKRGRKSKNQEILFKPEEVMDYVARNYPDIGIDRIRNKVVNGLKVMKNIKNNPYLLYKFPYKNVTYYYDDNGAILNTDGVLIGYFIHRGGGIKKMYMFDQKNKDTRTVDEIIEDGFKIAKSTFDITPVVDMLPNTTSNAISKKSQTLPHVQNQKNHSQNINAQNINVQKSIALKSCGKPKSKTHGKTSTRNHYKL
jgi:hypothetical protein